MGRSSVVIGVTVIWPAVADYHAASGYFLGTLDGAGATIAGLVE
ncbi:hypothetical protein [Parahaliea mediterranea]|nr:hypothetical protein [Parahaliea mediterranea]